MPIASDLSKPVTAWKPGFAKVIIPAASITRTEKGVCSIAAASSRCWRSCSRRAVMSCDRIWMPLTVPRGPRILV